MCDRKSSQVTALSEFSVDETELWFITNYIPFAQTFASHFGHLPKYGAEDARNEQAHYSCKPKHR